MADQPTHIGPYAISRLLARGGMGEVFLVTDPSCDRKIALKRIRSDLKEHAPLKNRFLREAKITASLTHPGVISIYSIHHEGEELYYTMPYVEGETFKQILRGTPRSIASLLPIFRSLCQTIAYAHSKGVIHRDLKPENILVGKFGEVVLLDWGLAELHDAPQGELGLTHEELSAELTHPGKIVGTLAYMAPERALGAPATFQSDIYALGVILYQILTLHLPFHRTTLKEFRKIHTHETLLEPEEVAPYRDVPPRLARLVKKCLEADPLNRCLSVEALVHDLASHMEGKAEWFEVARLDISRKKDWEFQENVLISKNRAVTRTTEAAGWVSIMLSAASFAEDIRLETRVRIGESGEGIGFLLNVPEESARENPLEGYCLWLGTQGEPTAQLFRNTVEVMQFQGLRLERGQWHHVLLEKSGNNIHFSLDGVRRFTYLSYLPLAGSRVGLLAKDADFSLDPITIYLGSPALQVSCLSIPDAFLTNKDYKRALADYRRIGRSFPGHAEGREALFRAGITLLEQAKNTRNEKRSRAFYAMALIEFEKLHTTPGAPLEYLGKALCYQAQQDNAEEIKCLELALRRYYKHPLIAAIKEQIVYRMHESAQRDRRSAYQLILIVLRHLPEIAHQADSLRLFRHLISHSEPLPFLETPLEPATFGELHFAIVLAFWLASPTALTEIFEDLSRQPSLDVPAIGDLLFALIEIGAHEEAEQLMANLEARGIEGPVRDDLSNVLKNLKPLFGRTPLIPSHEIRSLRSSFYLMQQALDSGNTATVLANAEPLLELPLSREERILLDGYRISALLLENRWEEAGALFDTYPLEMLNQETTILHPLYGCWLYATEGEEIALVHLAGVLETPFPRSWALLGHEITNHITENPAWEKTSFQYERKALYRQLICYYHCSENPSLEAYYQDCLRKEL